MDQAATLRKMVSTRKPPERKKPNSNMRVITITSGKGGVGKTNIVLNLCVALSARKHRVFLLDADLGLANVDVLLGVTPTFTLEHLLNGEKTVNEILVEGPGGVKILPGSSGISELAEMSYEQQMKLFGLLQEMDSEVDYLFIDTGAGISSNVLRFNASAGEVVIIASPEPTSITDAYALIKLLAIKYHIRAFNLIANSVNSEEDGLNVYKTLHRVCDQFLKVELNFMGSIPFDPAVRKSVRQQKPWVQAFPKAPASKKLLQIVQKFEKQLPPSPSVLASNKENPQSQMNFWDRLLHWKKVK